MNIDIQKIENGWLLIRNYPSLDKRELWSFPTLQALAEWIISNAEKV